MRQLSPRQQRVLALLYEGLTNKEIAATMGISSAGVKKHLATLMRRYGVGRRTALVRRAFESGEMPPRS